MAEARDPVPDDKDVLKAALIETRARLAGAVALIEHLQLVIAKMKREKFGPRSERSQRLLDQLELELEELVFEHQPIRLLGFSNAQLDIVLSDEAPKAAADPSEEEPDLPADPTTRPGDIWRLGHHLSSFM